ncbi:MAG: transposase [Gammaproteobacteria bacterium]|nr:transposase [Gammaproteobacteria bacterium]
MARINTEGGERRVGAAGKRGRRKWPVGEKVRIVQEVERTGAAVSEIARRHGAHTSMLTRWRAQYRAGQLGTNGAASAAACLVPVRMMRDTPRLSRPAREPAPAISAAGAIEVRLASGQQVCIRGTVDAGMLRAVLEELSRS